MGPCWQNCSSTAASSGSSLGECTDTVCFPKAQEADREAIKAAGIGYAKAQLPMLMRAVYGNAKPRCGVGRCGCCCCVLASPRVWP